MTVLVLLDAVQQNLRIDLFSPVHVSHYTHRVFRNQRLDAHYRRYLTGYRQLKAGRRQGIPKNMDMHRYILFKWAPINILRRASGNISQNTILTPLKWGSERTQRPYRSSMMQESASDARM